MDSVKSVLQEELEYSLKVRERVQEALAEIPKGNLSEKQIYGRRYFYLAYRQGPKVKTVYLGKLSPDEAQVYREKIAKRKLLRKMLRDTKQKIVYLKKALHVKVSRPSDLDHLNPVGNCLSSGWDEGHLCSLRRDKINQARCVG